jgi:hypothetical protein
MKSKLTIESYASAHHVVEHRIITLYYFIINEQIFVTFLEASSWRLYLAVVVCFSRLQVGGCRGSDPEQMLFVRRGGGLRIHSGQHLHEVRELLGVAWLG